MYNQGYQDQQRSPYAPPRQRGGCLVCWLFFIVVVPALSLLLSLTGIPQQIISDASDEAAGSTGIEEMAEGSEAGDIAESADLDAAIQELEGMESADEADEFEVSPAGWIFGIITTFLTIACGIGIWMWKKWGFYGYLGVAILEMLLGFFTDGINVFAFIGTGIIIGIAWYVVTPYWPDMD